MNDRMTPMSFETLMTRIITEKKEQESIFGVHNAYRHQGEAGYQIFGRPLETPMGPAAGPHTQLAENIVAAYYGGSRFIELKTVQILDGEDLPVAKPCIKAEEEGYNVEWSTELYVPQAFAEYVKSWFAISVIAKEFELGGMNGFQFNMSVGYDLEGIQSAKIDAFIEGLKNAEQTEIYQECRSWLLKNCNLFDRITKEDILGISPNLCHSITLSTLHGCPPEEIEKIATYLLKDKRLHTFIKCNPTLLGYDYARELMDGMGYKEIAFGRFHFEDDLQYQDAVPMLKRLAELAEGQGLEFGVKITNTFPVDIKKGELPGEEMYLSGKALYPLSLAVAAKLVEDFDGKLRISYSGGADYFNIESLIGAGIWPVTMATTLLKPGGYERLSQIAEVLQGTDQAVFEGISLEKVKALQAAVITDKHHIKAAKQPPSRKTSKKAPLLDCFMPPCQQGCPIGQDITEYMRLVEEGSFAQALQVITLKNPLPFITGTICSHVCMSKCTRNYYETPVNIRRTKLEAAEKGFAEFMKTLEEHPQKAEPNGRQIAIVGGGPGGLAAAYFLAKSGFAVTVFEKEQELGGVVRYVIPEFRIAKEAIQKDLQFIEHMGITVKTETTVIDIQKLKETYDAVVLAVGASEQGILHLEEGRAKNAIGFLREFKEKKGQLSLGSRVIIIGGGNTAMDAARAAKRTKGVEKVSLVYRRTKEYMPADEEELELAKAEGIEFLELLSPIGFLKGKLLCRQMQLGAADNQGRFSVTQTERTTELLADTVIAAVGEKVPGEFYINNQIDIKDGKVVTREESLQTTLDDVYVVGDGVNGPATVVEAIRDATKAATEICEAFKITPDCINQNIEAEHSEEYKKDILRKRGRLAEETQGAEYGRCLECGKLCEICAEVCPNRANVSVTIPETGRRQIIHVDALCNECGNCKSFCPYSGAPYLDKFTVFATAELLEESQNQGFALLDSRKKTCRIRLGETVFTSNIAEQSPEQGPQLEEEIRLLINHILNQIGFLG